MMMTYNDEEDHLVSAIPTEGADVGSFLLLGGKMLFWPDSRKGNPLGGPKTSRAHIPGNR